MAISGIVFSAFYVVSLILLRLAVPADPSDPGVWLADPVLRNWVHIALNLVPFTGIAFLWFMGVLRNRIGLREDRFFATVFLGSGLLFVAMLFTAAAVAQGLLDTFSTGTSLPGQNETYAVGRRMGYTLMNTFGMKMAAVFIFVTSMIGLRTAVLSRWVALVGFAFGLVLLLVITDFGWIALLFPCWVLLVSTWILIADFHPGRQMIRQEQLRSAPVDSPGIPGKDNERIVRSALAEGDHRETPGAAARLG
ncbi:MAG TPA: hypothetical protein VE988_02955 [Gemmataceae bacterium]|nr:hypothetical protein [Gemmataceae bacterium]